MSPEPCSQLVTYNWDYIILTTVFIEHHLLPVKKRIVLKLYF